VAADRETFFAGLTALICLEIAPVDHEVEAEAVEEITQVFQRPASLPPPRLRRTPTMRLQVV
jgi:hypothetical protein